MPTLGAMDISIHYEELGDDSATPVLLLSGLGGVGRSWGPQIDRFAADYHVVLPDQRGTGRTTRARTGYTTSQLAADAAAVVDHLDLGPVHVVGSSTGGAIAQFLALDRPDLVRSLTLASSFAFFDAYLAREFAVRRKMVEQWGRRDALEAFSLFLFSPRFTADHPDSVTAWIDAASRAPYSDDDRRIDLQRIDMVAAHDTRDRLGEIDKPTLVVSGDHNACTTLHQSERLAAAIPGARLAVLAGGGELIEREQDHEFFEVVRSFIDGVEQGR
jgi:pimeloyl-ACP methyl ester carboxylesterase